MGDCTYVVLGEKFVPLKTQVRPEKLAAMRMIVPDGLVLLESM
jgi:hypothetical protein